MLRQRRLFRLQGRRRESGERVTMMLDFRQDRLALMPAFDQGVDRRRLRGVEAFLNLAFQCCAALRHLVEGTIFPRPANANRGQRADRYLTLLTDVPALLLA